MENENSFLVLFLTPVKEYLEDDDVSEILINGPENIYIEKHGKLQKTPARFMSEPALKAAATNIAKSVGRLLNDDNFEVRTRMAAGLVNQMMLYARSPFMDKYGWRDRLSRDMLACKDETLKALLAVRMMEVM